MNYSQPLIRGTLIQRYKRFLADVLLDDGRQITAHTNNSGSMMGLCAPGVTVYLSHQPAAHRRYKYTWEIVQINKTLVGINTLWPNKLVHENLLNHQIKELDGYPEIIKEKKYGDHSRMDFFLTGHASEKPCFIEVKNVTLKEKNHALFPDACTLRGQKHLQELMKIVQEGLRACMVYVVQREDVQVFSLASDIDPQYTQLFHQARSLGVEAFAYQAHVSLQGISLKRALPIKI